MQSAPVKPAASAAPTDSGAQRHLHDMRRCALSSTHPILHTEKSTHMLPPADHAAVLVALLPSHYIAFSETLEGGALSATRYLEICFTACLLEHLCSLILQGRGCLLMALSSFMGRAPSIRPESFMHALLLGCTVPCEHKKQGLSLWGGTSPGASSAS